MKNFLKPTKRCIWWTIAIMLLIFVGVSGYIALGMPQSLGELQCNLRDFFDAGIKYGWKENASGQGYHCAGAVVEHDIISNAPYNR